jgi:hypothetical protein
MERYQYNSIKSIYGKGTLDNLSTITETIIDEYYKYNHRINSNGIQFPDKIDSINSYHGISSYTYISQIIDSENYPKVSLQKYKNLYKILKAKDIDWDNAYLKYLSIQKNYNEPIAYQVFDKESGKIDETTYFCYDYIFDRELCNNTYMINSTYELINVIDYLFTRYNALRFELNNVKGQRRDKEEYASKPSQIKLDDDDTYTYITQP